MAPAALSTIVRARTCKRRVPNPRGLEAEGGPTTLLELGYDWEAIGTLKEKGAIP